MPTETEMVAAIKKQHAEVIQSMRTWRKKQILESIDEIIEDMTEVRDHVVNERLSEFYVYGGTAGKLVELSRYTADYRIRYKES